MRSVLFLIIAALCINLVILSYRITWQSKRVDILSERVDVLSGRIDLLVMYPDASCRFNGVE